MRGNREASTRPNLAERLGFSEHDRLLIVNCDDLGCSHAANVGVYEAIRRGRATSATLMVPGPWARDAAAGYRGEDVGVHLTLNAEWDRYRWGPITQAPSLLDGDGGFPRTVADLWEHADLDEVRRECRAQIERAIFWGFDVSHLDSHLRTLELRPEFFDVYIDLAEEFRLPVRLGDATSERLAGFPFRDLASSRSVVYPDHLVSGPWLSGSETADRKSIEKMLLQLPPGVSEAHFRPAADTPELRAMCDDWRNRVDDHRFLLDSDGLAEIAEEQGITLIGYLELREMMRREAPAPA